MRIFILFPLAIVAGCGTSPIAESPRVAVDAPTANHAPSSLPVSFEVNRPAERASYGYTPTDPVKVGGPDGGPARERMFLDQLAGLRGEKITYRRLGSCCSFDTPRGFMGKGLLDKYEIMIGNDPEPRILYLNMYDFEEPLLPGGFTRRN